MSVPQTLLDSVPTFTTGFRRDTFVDLQTGVEIHEYTGDDGTLPQTWHSAVNIVLPNGQQMQLRFQIPAASRHEAFANFQTTAQSCIKDALEQTQRRILVPGQAASNGRMITQ